MDAGRCKYPFSAKSLRVKQTVWNYFGDGRNFEMKHFFIHYLNNFSNLPIIYYQNIRDKNMSYDFIKDTYKVFIQIEFNETTKNLKNPKNILSYRFFT